MGRSGEEYSGQRKQKMQSPGKGTSLGSPRNRKNPQNPMQNQGSVGGGRGLGRGDGSGLIYLGTSRSTEGLEAGY